MLGELRWEQIFILYKTVLQSNNGHVCLNYEDNIYLILIDLVLAKSIDEIFFHFFLLFKKCKKGYL